ncbi:MAG: hypothetical protein LBG80_04240 [Bacteroidales bacterium]|jgi:hypothetical protein|nr:hypothetical protein [Bacteroidales bacterium]
MENVLKINAGIACSDRTNEVEPRPNGEETDEYPPFFPVPLGTECKST